MEKQYGCLKLSTLDWLKLLGILLVHACLLFGALLSWANRVVALEVRTTNIEQALQTDMAELRADIKELLKRVKE